MPVNDAQTADRLSRRRARVLPVLTVFYLAQQVSFFSAAEGGSRAVDHVKVGAWILVSLVLLAALTSKGFWLRKAAVRDMIDDEGTRANRLDALRLGFVIAVGTGIALYFIEQIEPMSAREAIHLIVSLGLGAGLIRFAMLERRAHRA